jgi:lipopolysaccharide export system ATP-binding protein
MTAPDQPTSSEPRADGASAVEAPAANNALLHTHGLVKSYGGRRVVNQVEITVSKGEIVGLLGKNGAGKTTTFYMIVGLIRPDEGTVTFNGADVTRMPMHKRAQRGMGYLSQEPSTFRTLTVEQNIMAILETLDLTDNVRARRCRRLLEELDIVHLAKQKAYTLSGGERRRLEICRALVISPTFIMLDEPFSGVDPIAVFDVQKIIRQLSERDIGILLTDHNVRETLSIVDRAYIINEGVVEVSGPSDFLINDPTARKIYLGEQFSM